MNIAGDEFGIAAFQHMIGGQNGDSARWNDIWNDDDAVESSLGNFLAARVSEEKARRGPPWTLTVPCGNQEIVGTTEVGDNGTMVLLWGGGIPNVL